MSVSSRRRVRKSREFAVQQLESRLLLTANVLGNDASDVLPLYAPGELLIGFHDADSGPGEISAVLNEGGFGAWELSDFHDARDLAGSPFARVRFSTSDDMLATAAQLSQLPGVSYAEPNYMVSVSQIPNDAGFSNLWGMHNTGQTGGTFDADIDAPEAWDLQTGNMTPVVGVIDTGIDYTHPDLYLNVWINQGEIPAAIRNGLVDTDGDNLITFWDLNAGANAGQVADANGNNYIDGGDLLANSSGWEDGSDNDGNGYTDDLVGWNFVNNTNDPFDDNINTGHGTHVSGTIGGIGNNAVGVAGVNWQVRMIALKFLNSSGGGTLLEAVNAVNYATTVGADLTSNSWGGGGFSQTLYNAIQAGSLFVAASGNSSSNNDQFPAYPASYDLSNIISVAATDHNDNYAGFSNIGATTVDLAAPGVNIYSTNPTTGYRYLDGTSMATPHVAGAAALLIAEVPGLSVAEIKAALMDNVDPIPGASKSVTNGRLNVFRALESISSGPRIRVVPSSGLVTDEGGGQATFNVSLTEAPTEAFSISITSDDTTEGTVDKDSLTFSPADWAAQIVTVTGLDDVEEDFADGDIRYTIVTGPVSGSSNYSGIDPADVSVTNLDLDVPPPPPIQIIDNNNQDTGGFSRTGLWSYWTNQGYADPGDNVSDVHQDAGAGLDTARWSFPATPGATYQVAVTWTGGGNRATNSPFRILDNTTERFATTVNQQLVPQADEVESGTPFQYLGPPVAVTSTTLVVELTDLGVNGFVNADAVRIELVDVGPQINVSPVSGLVTDEAGGQATFDVSLTEAPTEAFTISITSSDASEGTVDQASLTFTPTDWATQRVTVTGVDDVEVDFVDGDIPYTIVTGPVSGSSNYAGIDPADVSVTNLDLDTPPDTTAPTADLSDPTNGATLLTQALNAQGYLDVTFNDVGDGLDTASIDGNEVAIRGAVGTAVLNGSAALVSGTTYRYAFSGNFVDGTVQVDFEAGTFQDLAGNLNALETESFTLTTPPPPPMIQIIDNNTQDTGGFSRTGSWTYWTGQGYADPSDNVSDVHQDAGAGLDTARWSFPATPGATYQVSVTWTGGGNRATNSPFRILDGTTEVFATNVNQQLFPQPDETDAGTAFQYLGGPITSSSGTLVVELSDEGVDGFVNADAVRLEKVVPSSGPALAVGMVSGVGGAWETVNLSHTYSSMVVVTTLSYGGNDIPAVTRVRNASGSSFEVRVQQPGNSVTQGTYDVQYLVVEEGTYTLENDGIQMEAVLFNSTRTDLRGSWVGQLRSYGNSYSNPVVVGQVMTANDADWSVFWARGSRKTDIPSASTLRVGKHVAEDPDTARANEDIGYVVFETGSGSVSGYSYQAAVGADTVRGTGNNPPYSYSHGLAAATNAIVSAAAMDGNDGAWPVLYGNQPLTATTLNLAVEEDQLSDSERNHTTEQVAYLVFAPIEAGSASQDGSGATDVLITRPLTAATSASQALLSSSATQNDLPEISPLHLNVATTFVPPNTGSKDKPVHLQSVDAASLDLIFRGNLRAELELEIDSIQLLPPLWQEDGRFGYGRLRTGARR